MTDSYRSPSAGGRGLDPLDCLPIAAYVDEVDSAGAIHLAYNSARYADLTGFSPDAFALDAWAWDERVHPDDLPAYQLSFDRLWHQLVEQDVEYRFLRRDGSWVWLHDRASAVRDEARGVTVINGVIVDVTARRRAEQRAAAVSAILEQTVRARTGELEETVERLRASEARLRHAQALARVGSFEWWAATGSVVGSDELYAMYGIPAGTPVDIGMLRALTHPDDLPAFDAAASAADQGGDSTAFEMRILRGDEVRHLEVHAEKVRAEDGSLLCLRGAAQDITERKRSEDQNRWLNARLNDLVARRTEQLDAATGELEALAYSISHDVRAPLRAIDGFSGMVIEDAGERLSTDDLAHLRRVREAAQRMGDLIDDLLGLSHVSRRDMHREECDVSRLAEDVCDELRTERPDRDVRTTISGGLVADADPALVRVLLRELLGNAWKFTEPHDFAHVEVGTLDLDGERVFYVRDDGVGFDMQYADHLFGAFQRLHPPGRFEGNGVGLATVQRLVRRHGGRCWAEAEVERGATLLFTLPPSH